MAQRKQLYRSEHHRMIAGVCGGLGDLLGIDPTLIRLLWVVLTVFGGAGIVLYLAMWVVVPPESRVGQPAADIARAGVEEMRSKLKSPGRSS